MISARHGWLAFMCAALLHVLALGLFFAMPSEGAKDKGEQGIEVDLGMLGNLGEALTTTEDISLEDPKEITQEKPKELPKETQKEAPQKPETEPVKQADVPEPPKQKVVLKVKKAPTTEKKRVQVTSKKVPVDSPPSSQQALLSISQTTAQTTAQKKISTGVGNAQTTGGNPGAEQSYFALLAATLAKNKRYPTASRRKGEEGIVVLSFVVDRFGGVSAAQIKTSSGYSRLDAAVLRMLKKSRRLPAFPVEMKQAELLINIPISFELNAMR